ncbi:bromo adjacent homology (BAH) domain protein [Artemisia annua]|uniref:Bromo adjacent homology (BAH) domain protein n=1 Tax=Artemisia annua TaxID=35608 RepID=A0A2U1LFT8_ARTAN|nr:bromo adjacent homology (BAH) domain protein [Artemisia annua]
MLSNQKNSIKNAKPIGVVLRISGDGENMRSHYNALDFCGHTYKIKDTVLLAHDSHGQMNKPWVVIIKDITGMKNGNIMIYVQGFYRPSEIFIGKNMESFVTRELFYSFHKHEVHAETIMHKCIIHFITEKSQIPLRKKYPGFIVQKVYNPNTKRLIKLTNKDFLPDMKSEIEELVLKTTSHLGIIPAIKVKMTLMKWKWTRGDVITAVDLHRHGGGDGCGGVDGRCSVSPIGVLRISGDGENMRSHYNALDFCGHTYKIKDTVLLAHDSHGQMNKPWVVIIKDITGMKNGNIMIYVQWFYRPSEIFIGKNMESFDTRELFYSFHKDEVHAETIMHKCIMHFITEKSQIPLRKKYLGFIVQKVYNPNTKRPIKLTNKDFLPDMKSEIEELVLKTTSHLEIIPA